MVALSCTCARVSDFKGTVDSTINWLRDTFATPIFGEWTLCELLAKRDYKSVHCDGCAPRAAYFTP